MMENDDGVGGIGDIDDSGLDNAEKADAEGKSNENDNDGGQGTYKIKTELEHVKQALQETLGQNFLNSKDMDHLMMDVVDEEPPKVKQEANATSGQEAGASTSVSAAQQQQV